MKSIIRRPSENRPVGRWKNVSPYGVKQKLGGLLELQLMKRFPVSERESPKLKMELKQLAKTFVDGLKGVATKNMINHRFRHKIKDESMEEEKGLIDF